MLKDLAALGLESGGVTLLPFFIHVSSIKNLNIELRVTPVDKNALELMRDSGCRAVSYGIESVSQDILHSMKKRITVSQIEHTLKVTHDTKLGIGGNILENGITTSSDILLLLDVQVFDA